jgi:hypothetical protein
MMHAVGLSNAQPAWMLLWPQDLFRWNEFNPAKKYWSVLWRCLPSWPSASIVTNTGWARAHQPNCAIRARGRGRARIMKEANGLGFVNNSGRQPCLLVIRAFGVVVCFRPDIFSVMPSHEFLQRTPHGLREERFRKAILRMLAYPLK